MKTKHLLILTLAIAGTGCELPKPKTYADAIATDVHTIKHEGHLFVIFFGFEKGGICHHPSCPCMKTKPDTANP